MAIVCEKAVKLKKEFITELEKHVYPDKNENYWYKDKHRIIVRPITWAAQLMLGSRPLKIGGRHYTHPNSISDLLSLITEVEE